MGRCPARGGCAPFVVYASVLCAFVVQFLAVGVLSRSVERRAVAVGEDGAELPPAEAAVTVRRSLWPRQVPEPPPLAMPACVGGVVVGLCRAVRCHRPRRKHRVQVVRLVEQNSLSYFEHGSLARLKFMLPSRTCPADSGRDARPASAAPTRSAVKPERRSTLGSVLAPGPSVRRDDRRSIL